MIFRKTTFYLQNDYLCQIKNRTESVPCHRDGALFFFSFFFFFFFFWQKWLEQAHVLILVGYNTINKLIFDTFQNVWTRSTANSSSLENQIKAHVPLIQFPGSNLVLSNYKLRLIPHLNKSLIIPWIRITPTSDDMVWYLIIYYQVSQQMSPGQYLHSRL